jgi:hypothetical protein
MASWQHLNTSLSKLFQRIHNFVSGTDRAGGVPDKSSEPTSELADILLLFARRSEAFLTVSSMSHAWKLLIYFFILVKP